MELFLLPLEINLFAFLLDDAVDDGVAPTKFVLVDGVEAAAAAGVVVVVICGNCDVDGVETICMGVF